MWVLRWCPWCKDEKVHSLVIAITFTLLNGEIVVDKLKFTYGTHHQYGDCK